MRRRGWDKISRGERMAGPGRRQSGNYGIKTGNVVDHNSARMAAGAARSRGQPTLFGRPVSKLALTPGGGAGGQTGRSPRGQPTGGAAAKWGTHLSW